MITSATASTTHPGGRGIPRHQFRGVRWDEPAARSRNLPWAGKVCSVRTGACPRPSP